VDASALDISRQEGVRARFMAGIYSVLLSPESLMVSSFRLSLFPVLLIYFIDLC